METDRMLYLVTEYASKGEIFGEDYLKLFWIVVKFSVILDYKARVKVNVAK